VDLPLGCNISALNFTVISWMDFCATPLENWNDAPGRRDEQFEKYGYNDQRTATVRKLGCVCKWKRRLSWKIEKRLQLSDVYLLL